MPREGVSNQRVCNNHCVMPLVYEVGTERSQSHGSWKRGGPQPAFHRAKVTFPGI